jgi:hypothetical protein
VSNEELARSIKAGDVRRDDWLWHERLGQWTAAGTIDFLWPGQADDYADTREAASEQREPALARPIGTPAGSHETPSLTALYLSRRRLQRDTHIAAGSVTGASGFVDDIASAAGAAPADDRHGIAAGAATSASAYVGSTDAAEKPRDVLAAKELPPLPPRRNLPRQPARTEPRPPPLPNT